MAVAGVGKQKRSDVLSRWALRIATFVVVAGVWELSTVGLQSLLIPTFSQTMAGLYRLAFVDGRLWQPLLLSNQALVLGYAICVLVGVPVGLAMARAKAFERIIDPYIAVILAVPVAPLIPIVMMAMGLGLASRVFIVVLFAIVFITVNTRAGVRGVDPSLIEMARSFGASEGQIWRRILIPGAMPAILAGLRIGLGRAITGMVIAELLLVASGVGRLLLEFRATFQKELVFAVVLAVVLESTVLMALMRVFEQKFAPWANDIAKD